MAEITKYNGQINELYSLWLDVSKNIPYTEKLDVDSFKNAYLESALTENICYLAREEGTLKGAAMVHIYPGWGAVLQLWVPHVELGNETSIKLLEKAIGLCREKPIPQISPKPLLGCSEYNAFFTSRGFIRNEEHPEALWMRKTLETIPNLKMPEGVAITFTEDLDESGDIEGLARLEVDIAREQHDLKIDQEENILALRNEMLEENVTYGIAKIGSEVVGYSRTIFTDLLSGEKIVKNRGLAVNERFRKKGIGEALLISSMAMVKDTGYEEMYISTHSKNPARYLYTRVGFETIEIVPSLVYKVE